MQLLTKNRFPLSLAAACALTVFLPAVATGQPSPGLTTNAVDNGDCTVTFTLDNRTNTTFFTMDYWIDDEPLTGTDFGTGPTGRRPPLTAGVAEGTPLWPGSPYRSDIEPPFRTETTVDLKAVDNLPNPEAATHVVHYRVILGPESDDYVAEQTTTVTGCEEKQGNGSLGFTGSSFGSTGSMGSSDSIDGNWFDELLELFRG